MAIEVVIKQKGLLKKPVTEDVLSPAGLRAGHWNQAGVLDPGPEQTGRVLCDPVKPGRGFYLRGMPGEKEQVCLRQTLPCTAGDMDLFYERIEAICRFWKTDRFVQDGEECRLSDIPRMKEEQNRGSEAFLRYMAEQWKKDSVGVFTGAVYPLYIEPEALERMRDGDMDFFEQYLAEKQAGDRYYAKPSFYRHDNGVDILGLYSITEGVDSILPLEPFVPPLYSVFLQDFHVTDEQVTEWRVSLNRVWEENGEMKGETLGYVPFGQFAQRVKLEQCGRFDARHVCVRVDDLTAALG